MTYHQSDHVAAEPPLRLEDLNTTVNHEPRLEDVRLAKALGFDRPWDIRKLIERHRAALERFGAIPSTIDGISATVALNARKRGRPGRTFWLSKRQALYLCTKSETPRATDATIEMVEVFDQWLVGVRSAVHVKEHTRRPPTPAPKPVRPRLEHRVAMAPTADPGVMRVTADLPLSVASDLMTLFATYETTIAIGLARAAH